MYSNLSFRKLGEQILRALKKEKKKPNENETFCFIVMVRIKMYLILFTAFLCGRL